MACHSARCYDPAVRDPDEPVALLIRTHASDRPLRFQYLHFQSTPAFDTWKPRQYGPAPSRRCEPALAAQPEPGVWLRVHQRSQEAIRFSMKIIVAVKRVVDYNVKVR